MDKEREISGRGPARSAPRDSLFLLTDLSTPEGSSLGKARVRNLSATGLMAECERAVSTGARLCFNLRGVGPVVGTVAWSREGRIGVAFDAPIDPQLARKPVGAAGRQSLPDYLRVVQAPRR